MKPSYNHLTAGVLADLNERFTELKNYRDELCFCLSYHPSIISSEDYCNSLTNRIDNIFRRCVSYSSQEENFWHTIESFLYSYRIVIIDMIMSFAQDHHELKLDMMEFFSEYLSIDKESYYGMHCSSGMDLFHYFSNFLLSDDFEGAFFGRLIEYNGVLSDREFHTLWDRISKYINSIMIPELRLFHNKILFDRETLYRLIDSTQKSMQEKHSALVVE